MVREATGEIFWHFVHKPPELKGFVVGGVLKTLDHEEVNPKQMRKIKMAEEACVKERDQTMPSFGKINVQDPSDVRKCMHFVVTELNVKGLVDLFDQDPTVANAPNGLIDLRTGALLPHHPQDLCNNQTSMYIRGASTRPTARFRTFLMEVLPSVVIEWLQMFLGYCLTGEMSEELFVIANGLSGANGKGVLDEALRKGFGSYYCAGSKAIFIKPSFKANGSLASSHLMQIQTKRLVKNNESEGVEELRASFLKEATGGGPLQARELFCKSQSYVPQYKLVLFTNYRPHFPSEDSALLRRLVLMMFNYTFKTPDELDSKNKWHKPIDVSIKEYFESDEGAADTWTFAFREQSCTMRERRLHRPQRSWRPSRTNSRLQLKSMPKRTTNFKFLSTRPARLESHSRISALPSPTLLTPSEISCVPAGMTRAWQTIRR
jgi:P4 family phage/plasmid primase-like protien